jgi:hypothetical protein
MVNHFVGSRDHCSDYGLCRTCWCSRKPRQDFILGVLSIVRAFSALRTPAPLIEAFIKNECKRRPPGRFFFR